MVVAGQAVPGNAALAWVQVTVAASGLFVFQIAFDEVQRRVALFGSMMNGLMKLPQLTWVASKNPTMLENVAPPSVDRSMLMPVVSAYRMLVLLGLTAT